MPSFFGAKNLVDSKFVETEPWAWMPPDEALQRVRSMPKVNRRALMSQTSTVWQVYTPVRTSLGSYVTNDSPPVAIRGWVADYDVQVPKDAVEKMLEQIPVGYRPQWVEQTLGMKWRLVWIFEREVLVAGSPHCHQFFEIFARNCNAKTALPGFDPASLKPAERWTNGGEWFPTGAPLIPADLTHGICIEAARKASVLDSGKSVPLEEVYTEINRRWPGRWQGDFKVDALGVRFWDDHADNQTGAQVKPDGMLCFTGDVPFMRWEDILGVQWMRDQAAKHIGKLAEGIFFDGRDYWANWDDAWWSMTRGDVVLKLKTNGVSDRVVKGETASDCDHVLAHIQTANRVHGAGPLVNYRPGVVRSGDKRILNTTRLRPVVPADLPGDWAWIRSFLEGHFAGHEGHDPLNHFLAWLQRAYISLRDYRPLMGQALFLCGPKHNGKTLLMERIVKPLLGNISANPYDWLCGHTRFNDELFQAFLWSINDEEAPDERERKKFLARLKASVVNPTHTYEPKFCSRVNVEHTGRLVVTLNDDPQAVGLLPEASSNTADKMCFFRSQPFAGVWGTNREIEETIAAELPAFARWLLDWTAPETVLEKTRMGVKSYYDPDILALSRQQMYSFNLRELLVVWVRASELFSDTGEGTPTESWEGTPTALLSELATCAALTSVTREWTVAGVARSLTTLARDPDSGIEFVAGSSRLFRIKKSYFQ